MSRPTSWNVWARRRIRAERPSVFSQLPDKSAIIEHPWTLELSADGRDVHMLLDIEADTAGPLGTKHQLALGAELEPYGAALWRIRRNERP